jgi:hypothetical protein
VKKLNDHGTGRAPRAADCQTPVNAGPSYPTIAVRAALAGRAARRTGMRTRWGAARPSAQDWILPDGQRISAAIDARRAAMKRQVAGLFA